jgi:hypothetical protein
MVPAIDGIETARLVPPLHGLSCASLAHAPRNAVVNEPVREQNRRTIEESALQRGTAGWEATKLIAASSPR